MSDSNLVENVLEIKKFPDPVLKKISKPVEVFDSELENFVDDLFRAMRVHDGVGLAAPQVGVSKRIAVVEYEEKSYVLINPKILEQKGIQEGEEGCLSFPGIYANVKRPQWVKIEVQDTKGEKHILEGEGYVARAFLHEMDHLNGKLFVDYLSNLKKNAIKTKIAKGTGGHF
ncbi:MAG: peptide deformylase [Synergistaceae bacterium]|nr:peptide deformylase [Synergistaceae bacterium]